jgi:periplasmic mercuric ion binding protein
MKTLFLALMIFSSTAFAGEIHVKVQGMVCSMCAQGITKKFKDLKEVKTVDVNLDNKFVKIMTNDGLDVSDEKVTEIIKEAGYNVAAIERK